MNTIRLPISGLLARLESSETAIMIATAIAVGAGRVSTEGGRK